MQHSSAAADTPLASALERLAPLGRGARSHLILPFGRQPIEPAWLRHMGPLRFGHINFRSVIAFEVEAFADASLEWPKRARTPLAALRPYRYDLHAKQRGPEERSAL